MNNAQYWVNRFEQLEQAQHSMAQLDKAEIEKQYAQTQQVLDGQIALWYQRFADNNKITLAEAKQYVQGNMLDELKWNVHEYIEHGKDVSGNWKKELENASAKFHITKLEALKIQTQQSLEELFSKVNGTVKQGANKSYTTGYYHTAFELQKGFGVGFDISSIDQSQFEKVISKPWANDKYNFSQRIWGYKNQLISTVHSILTENIKLGSDPQKAIDKIAVAMKNSKENAGRLVMTEEAYFSSLSQRDCFEKLGVEKYEIVATLDDRTSAICQSLDGKIYDLKDYQAGATAPPFHPYCRSTTAPWFDTDFGMLGERTARDGDGKTYYIPEDFTYPEWKKAFVNGDKSGFDLKVIEGTDHYSYPKKTDKKSPKPIDNNGKSGIIKTKKTVQLNKPVDSTDPNYNKCIDLFKQAKVKYNPVSRRDKPLTDEEIINELAGADKTSGSCASAAMAYIGQRNGLDVHDFRGGKSMTTFRSWDNLTPLTQIKGMKVYHTTGDNDLTVGRNLLKNVENNKEYYLCVGRHASIVRKTADGILQYLELQSDKMKGWQPFIENPFWYGKDEKMVLKKRFGCTSGFSRWAEKLNFIIDLDESDLDTDEINSILGYINTDVDKQKKGEGGNIK